MNERPWTKIDLRKGEKTLPPAHKKVLLYIDGEYQTGYIGGLNPLSENRRYVIYGNVVRHLTKCRVWWQDLPQPPI